MPTLVILRLPLVHFRLSAIRHVITPQPSKVAQIQPAVGDNWISPGPRSATRGLVRWRKSSSFAIGVRRRLDESRLTVLPVHIDAAVRVADGAGADGAI